MENPKSEARNPKQAQNSKKQFQKRGRRGLWRPLKFPHFFLWISFGFRNSDFRIPPISFGFRHSDFGIPPIKTECQKARMPECRNKPKIQKTQFQKNRIPLR